MKYSLLVSAIVLLLIPSITNATDYYYCDCKMGASSQCIAGIDSNSGTSDLSPRQTFANASITFSNFSAGDSILFCRGGSFEANAKTNWVNSKCTISNNCTVTSYDLPNQQNSQLPRPIITQSVDNNLFSLDDPGNADHEEGYSFSNLDLRCTGCLNTGVGFYFYNDIDNVIINNVSFNGFRIAIRLAANKSVAPGSDLDNITLNNLNIVNSKNQGVLGGANNLVISNSKFENNGSGTDKDHNIYISSGYNIEIKNNDVYRSSLLNGRCNGVSVVVHGVINNLLIEGNTVREDVGKASARCWGIAIDTGYAASFKPEAFTNITVRGNKVINVGSIGIGLASCDTCVIENNLILQ